MTIQTNSYLCGRFSCGCKPNQQEWRDFIDSAGGLVQGNHSTTYGIDLKCSAGSAGNSRGENTTDIQICRGLNSHVACAPCSSILGGLCNTITVAGTGSVIYNSLGGCVTGIYSSLLASRFSVSAPTICSDYSTHFFSKTQSQPITSTASHYVAHGLSGTLGCYSVALGGILATAGDFASVMSSGETSAPLACAPYSVAVGGGATIMGATSCYSAALYTYGFSSVCDACYSLSYGVHNRTFCNFSIASGQAIGGCACACGIYSMALACASVTAAPYSFSWGYFSRTDFYGELAYATGRFGTTVASAQIGHLSYFGQTTNTSYTELFLDNSSSRFTISTGTTYGFKLMITAFRDDVGDKGRSAAYVVYGAIKNVSGTTTILNTSVTGDFTREEEIVSSSSSIDSSSSSSGSSMSNSSSSSSVDSSSSSSQDDWDVQVTADDTLDALILKVKGSGTVKWCAKMSYVKVMSA